MFVNAAFRIGIAPIVPILVGCTFVHFLDFDHINVTQISAATQARDLHAIIGGYGFNGDHITIVGIFRKGLRGVVHD